MLPLALGKPGPIQQGRRSRADRTSVPGQRDFGQAAGTGGCSTRKIFGGAVAAINVTDEKLQLAKELGADLVIDARTEDPASVLQAHGGAR